MPGKDQKTSAERKARAKLAQKKIKGQLSHDELRKNYKSMAKFDPRAVDKYLAKQTQGKPTAKTPEMINQIEKWLEMGNTIKSLSDVPGMPHSATIYAWMGRDAELNARLTRAKKRGLASAVDKLEVESQNRAMDVLYAPDGRPVPNMTAVKRSQLIIDTKMRMAQLLDPDNFSPVKKTESKTLNMNINLEADEASRRLAHLLGALDIDFKRPDSEPE